MAAIFFAAVVVIGMYLIMNLFVAILLDAFAASLSQQQRKSISHPPEDKSELAESEGRRSGGGGGGGGSHGRAGGSAGRGEAAWRDSFLCVPPDSPVRRFADDAVRSVHFERAIIVVILLSSATLALDSPRLDHSHSHSAPTAPSPVRIRAYRAPP